ncbi:MAG: histidine phosphatase family protein [Acidimicrobiales bacterium]|nr:histidine phosphatase family protein [Acidimicrobiales bacterium]
MARLILVRHGRASAGWDVHADPGLDGLGRAQATALADELGRLEPMAIRVSPLRRTRETAAPLEARWGVRAEVDPGVAEIPSPVGVPMQERTTWLRAAMAGTWADLAADYGAWRDAVVERVLSLTSDTVVVSHFVAINAVVGRALGDDRVVVFAPDNCSRTTVDHDGRRLRVVELGTSAPDTLVR